MNIFYVAPLSLIFSSIRTFAKRAAALATALSMKI